MPELIGYHFSLLMSIRPKKELQIAYFFCFVRIDIDVDQFPYLAHVHKHPLPANMPPSLSVDGLIRIKCPTVSF
jgi:hypothetical protein